MAEWLGEQNFYFGGPERHLAAAAVSLLERGEAEAGLALSRELLALGGPKRRSYGTPSIKLGEDEYADALAKIAPALAPNRPHSSRRAGQLFSSFTPTSVIRDAV